MNRELKVNFVCICRFINFFFIFLTQQRFLLHVIKNDIAKSKLFVVQNVIDRAQRLHNALKRHCKSAYQALSKTQEYSLDTDRQARLVRPLAFDLLNERQTAFAKERLIKALESYGWKLGTGFLSTPLILDVLSEIDIEAAYRLLENEEMPGWLFMPKNGATTIWESWEGTQAQGGIASLNHYSKGAVCEWLFKTMCGIHIDGENHFTISPRSGGSFMYAQASYNSIFGQVESRWERADGKTVYKISIPVNCTAEIRLPNGTSRKVDAGDYMIEI